MKYKKVSLLIGSYICPDTPEGVARAKEALIADYDSSVQYNWDVSKMLVVEDETDKGARDAVPKWLLEDLAELEDDS